MKFLRRLKHELKVYQLVMRNGRTPKVAKVFLALAIFLDDIIIVPGLIILALRFVPKDVVEDCRLRASA